MAISVLASCQNKARSVKVIDEVYSDSISFTIYEGKNKTNADNDIQCTKYYSYKKLENGYEVRGADLRHLISFLQDVDLKDVIVDDRIDKNFYTLEYRGPDATAHKNHILKKFLDYYDLHINKNQKLEKGYTLGLENDKIKIYLAENNQNTSVEQNGSIVNMRNANLKILANVIQDLYGVKVNTGKERENLQGYNINFDSGMSITSLQNFLNEKYGIQFEEEQFSV
ncbi:hypothetical protein [Mesonia sp. HuA40]|uniref:hypothetical protein n=1 Tax=Mesonia sp. HuA40 TaxID=2602761 RepID=UPI0011CBB8BC|nr:hypothetical protein [Mesonia sp. HuA40]TXK71578.1 hypothetical protein FT993_09250 [Mesonia sp. HuA40]